MLESILREEGRSVLYIDCRELQKQSTDALLVGELANQTGYWPVFTLFNSMGNLIDLASVGLIGQKLGVSTSLVDQLTSILDVVANGLKRVANSHHAQAEREIKYKERQDALRKQERLIAEKIERGSWHDGRIDCVSGNGIMSELGIGDELIDPLDYATEEIPIEENPADKVPEADVDNVKAMPIVVIRNFSSKINGTKEELLDVLARWSASLVENQVGRILSISACILTSRTGRPRHHTQ